MKYYTSLLILLLTALPAFAIFGNDDEDKDESALEKWTIPAFPFVPLDRV